MGWLTDRQYFLVAVVLYGLSAIYSILLLRKGFRRDNRINYSLLLLGFGFHTGAMLERGFSLQRCPINNLYEATTFIAWTMVTAYLLIGAWSRLRFLGAFASLCCSRSGPSRSCPVWTHPAEPSRFSPAGGRVCTRR